MTVLLTMMSVDGTHEMVRCDLKPALETAKKWCHDGFNRTFRINCNDTLRLLYHGDHYDVIEVKHKPVQSDRHRVAISVTDES